MTRGQGDKVTREAGEAFRFVVLHHTGIAEAHFDLLIDWGGEGLLWAWRVLKGPAEWGCGPLAAVRIQDHRRVYLTYEGEISEGRGEVKRVAEGMGEVLGREGNWVRVRLGIGGEAVEVQLPA